MGGCRISSDKIFFTSYFKKALFRKAYIYILKVGRAWEGLQGFWYAQIQSTHLVFLKDIIQGKCYMRAGKWVVWRTTVDGHCTGHQYPFPSISGMWKGLFHLEVSHDHLSCCYSYLQILLPCSLLSPTTMISVANVDMENAKIWSSLEWGANTWKWDFSILYEISPA